MFFHQPDDIAIRARRNGKSVMEQIQSDAIRRRQVALREERRVKAKRMEAEELERKARFRASWVRMVNLAILAEKTSAGGRDVIDFSSSRRVMVSDIMREVSQRTGIGLNELKSARKTHNLVQARHYIYWRARRETTASFPQIGRLLGRRDHTTVIHGARRFQEALDRREEWAVMLAGVGR